MEYPKTINLLDNTPNQPARFRTKNWVEINDESRGTHNKDNQIRFKTSMLTSILHHYSDAYILVKGTITVADTAAQGQANNGANKKVIFKNRAAFTNSISRINNTQVDDASYNGVVMPLYNLIEYSDNYLKTFGILWQFYRDALAVNANGAIVDFVEANSSAELFTLNRSNRQQ